MRPNISVDLTAWLSHFQRELDALLADMFQLCSAEQRQYSDLRRENVSGVLGVTFTNAAAFGETVPQRAARNTFIAAMSKFSGFLDRLIATRRIAKDGIPIRTGLNSEAELVAYVKEYLDQVTAEVARDHTLTVPKKLDCFAGVDAGIKDLALDYNALRNALEHHHDLPKRDLTLRMQRIVPIIEDEEITALPATVEAGDRIGIRTTYVEKVFPANQQVVLEPQDAYLLICTIRRVTATAIFRWHVDSGKS
jgi:hypothetical protein